MDATGNLYFVDGGNGVIRKVNAMGTITTIAGGGAAGVPGDGGPAKNAYLGQPTSLAMDGLGNMFVLDSGHVRKIGTDGIMNAFAGYGNANVSGDGGPALDAGFWSPWVLAADSAGNVYIAESGSNGVVRKVAASGASTTSPFLSSLSPPLGVAGGQDFTLTVTGLNFVFGSTVLWDGGTLITQYVSPTVLAAGVPATLIATVGNHTIAVRTPAPASAQTSPILYAVQAIPPGTPTLVAAPNPVPVPPGYYSIGVTTLTWNAPGHNNVYISQTVYGAGGAILATGGSTGSKIVRTYPDGTRFFLIDADTNHTLVSLTLTTFTDTRNIGTPGRPGRAIQPLRQTEGEPAPGKGAGPGTE